MSARRPSSAVLYVERRCLSHQKALRGLNRTAAIGEVEGRPVLLLLGEVAPSAAFSRLRARLAVYSIRFPAMRKGGQVAYVCIAVHFLQSVRLWMQVPRTFPSLVTGLKHDRGRLAYSVCVSSIRSSTASGAESNARPIANRRLARAAAAADCVSLRHRVKISTRLAAGTSATASFVLWHPGGGTPGCCIRRAN